MDKYTKVDMPFSKRLENFWFYNKAKVLIIGFFAVATIYSLVVLLTTPNPDYKIMLAADIPSASRSLEELTTELEAYGKDVNGDGKVVVDVYDCCTSKDADNATASVQFVTQLDIDEILIYMLDDTKLKYVREYFEDEGESAFLTAFDGKDNISCKGSDFDKKFGETYGTLKILIRNPENSNIKSEDAEKAVDPSITFAENIANSKKTK